MVKSLSWLHFLCKNEKEKLHHVLLLTWINSIEEFCYSSEHCDDQISINSLLCRKSIDINLIFKILCLILPRFRTSHNILNMGSIFRSIKILLYDTALESCGFKLNTFSNPIWIYSTTYLSSPTIIMGSLGLNSTWVSLVFFFWATICSQRGSYLLIFKSYKNIWKWIKQNYFKTYQ